MFRSGRTKEKTGGTAESFIDVAKRLKSVGRRGKAPAKAANKHVASKKVTKTEDQQSSKKKKLSKKEREEVSHLLQQAKLATVRARKVKKKNLKSYDASSDEDEPKTKFPSWKKFSGKGSSKKKSKAKYDDSSDGSSSSSSRSSSSSQEDEQPKTTRRKSQTAKSPKSSPRKSLMASGKSTKKVRKSYFDSSDEEEVAKPSIDKLKSHGKGKKANKSYDVDKNCNSAATNATPMKKGKKLKQKPVAKREMKDFHDGDSDDSDRATSKRRALKNAKNIKKAAKEEESEDSSSESDSSSGSSSSSSSSNSSGYSSYSGSSSESESASSDSDDDGQAHEVTSSKKSKVNMDTRCHAPLELPKNPGKLTGPWKNPLQGWNNMPSRRIKQNGPRLQMRVPSRTHMWQRKKQRLCHDTAPFHWTKVTGDFEVICKVTGGMYTDLDKAGVMARLDESCWIFTGMEFYDGRPNHTTCLTLGTTDRSLTALPENAEKVGIWFCLKRAGDVVECFFSFEAKTWVQTRQGLLTKSPTVYVGICGAAPNGEGFKANWDYFRIHQS